MSHNRKYNLKALRALKGLTQNEAGALVGVSGDVWGSWERGKSYPDVLDISKIESAFGVSYNDIIFLQSDTVLNGI
ncbi:helix-turn-helix transcriptional regulator [Facklamia hominis]|uniref:helix-turn-helix transcriptional regulator n=1 Tax=Facklamia hominis TaxID=178214 RepID=UPI0029D41513|nr:helix-turn-helix transcriptional regulator [Facklamia hominis]WPJ91048.1 helix-turn-helix transcriptional regulator [Facklamia hominis]